MTQKRTSPTRDDRSYEIGHGKPPVRTRFLKGRSGNPLGRPKSSTTFDAVLKTELDAETNLTINGKHCEVSKREAIVRGLFEKALDGDTRAIEMFLQHMRKRDAANPQPSYVIKCLNDELGTPPATADHKSAGECESAGGSSATGDTSEARSHDGNDGNSEAAANPPAAPNGKDASERDRPAESSCAADSSTAAQPHTASERTISQPLLSTAAVRMRVPKPHQRFYICGATSGGRWYTADANRILENVHPDHVCSLEGHGCARL